MGESCLFGVKLPGVKVRARRALGSVASLGAGAEPIGKSSESVVGGAD